MAADANPLRQEVLAALAEGTDATWSEERFVRLALKIFAHQYERNAPYRRFCEARGASRGTARDWRDVPAVPTAAYKSAAVCTFPPEEATTVYLTSGTTLPGQRGRHYLRDTTLYDASLIPNLEEHLFPDVDRIRIGVLATSPGGTPESSLAHMLGAAAERWGAPGSRCYVEAGVLDLDALIGDLAAAEGEGEPVCLMGAAFAFVHLLDHCAGLGRRFRLPEGSRIMDTGGYKGRSREVPKEELIRAYAEWLGVPPHHVVNEYGMTEMSSQFYDTALRDFVRGHSRRRQKVPPPWVRTQVVDPETLAPLRPGHVGLLRHFDLANVDSVMAIQTDDLGVWLDEGFEILGRAAGAEPRGCSLAADELLAEKAARE
jgi:hypothetical protein